MNRNALELIVALVVGAVFGYLLLESSGYRGQSSMMPLAATGLAVALCLVWAAQAGMGLVRHHGERVSPNRRELLHLALIVASVIAYVSAMQTIGFFTATLVMIPVLSGILGYHNWKVSLLATLGFVIVVYAVFRQLLSIPLPPEALLSLVAG